MTQLMSGCDTMAFTVEISENTADALVVDILTNNLKYLRQDILRLSSKGSLLEHEVQELTDARNMEAHMMAVIRYYLPPDKWCHVQALLDDISTVNEDLRVRADRMLSQLAD